MLWGSQWTGNDPSGEAGLLQSFFGHVGSSPWLNSVTQYCQGVARGTTSCGSGTVRAGNPSAIFGGTWADGASLAPSHPTQGQLAAEAVSAAAHFGNTTSATNNTVQYVIATATGAENGDKCAWINTGQPGASSSVTMAGASLPAQSLWSNAANNSSGGCVLSY